MFNMKMSNTLKSFYALLLSSLTLHAWAVAPQTPDSTNTQFRGVQHVDKKAAELLRTMGNRTVPLFAGASVSANIAGAVLAQVTSYGEYEAALRLNLRNKYFPIIEAGLGRANATGESSHLHFRTSAPFARVGMDYNIKKDRRSMNRVFVGLRYGFSPFSYDLAGPDLADAYWKTNQPFQYADISSQAHWGEALFGLEAQIWKGIHLGWSVRYKLRFYEKDTHFGHAYYIPGYGKNSGTTTLGATFNLVLDLTLLGKNRKK